MILLVSDEDSFRDESRLVAASQVIEMLRGEGLEWSEGWGSDVTPLDMLHAMALEHGNGIVCSSKEEPQGNRAQLVAAQLRKIGICFGAGRDGRLSERSVWFPLYSHLTYPSKYGRWLLQILLAWGWNPNSAVGEDSIPALFSALLVVAVVKKDGFECINPGGVLELNGIGVVNPEHTALCEPIWSAVSSLIKGGADVTSVWQGKSPMHIAHLAGILEEFIQVLQQCGYDVRQVWAESKTKVDEWDAVSSAVRNPDVGTDKTMDMRRRRIFSPSDEL
jgi:hypothetical protein